MKADGLNTLPMTCFLKGTEDAFMLITLLKNPMILQTQYFFSSTMELIWSKIIILCFSAKIWIINLFILYPALVSGTQPLALDVWLIPMIRTNLLIWSSVLIMIQPVTWTIISLILIMTTTPLSTTAQKTSLDQVRFFHEGEKSGSELIARSWSLIWIGKSVALWFLTKELYPSISLVYEVNQKIIELGFDLEKMHLAIQGGDCQYEPDPFEIR